MDSSSSPPRGFPDATLQRSAMLPCFGVHGCIAATTLNGLHGLLNPLLSVDFLPTWSESDVRDAEEDFP